MLQIVKVKEESTNVQYIHSEKRQNSLNISSVIMTQESNILDPLPSRI